VSRILKLSSTHFSHTHTRTHARGEYVHRLPHFSYRKPAHYTFGPIEHGPGPSMHLFPMRNESCPAASDASTQKKKSCIGCVCGRKMKRLRFFFCTHRMTTAIGRARFSRVQRWCGPSIISFHPIPRAPAD